MSRLPISLAPLFLALPALPVQAQSRWTLFEARFDHAVASDTNLAVGFGGRLDSNSQDGVGDFWSTVSLPWTPQPNSGSTDGRYLHGLAAISSGVFVSFGGYQTRPGQQRTLPPETGVVAPPGEILFGTPTVTPRPRFGHAMVRDTLNNRVILFGGDLGGAQSNETWEYTRNNGGLGNWNNITDASAPPGRSLHCMAYDEVRGRILMFGGTGGIADTWEFNCANNQWTQLATPAPLQARTSAAMQYSVTGHFVLFGGLGSNSQPLADTWTWRASTGWTLEVNATGPTARSSQAMTWTGASSQRQVVMVGGRDGNGVITAESWIWTGTNWARPNAPESRYFGAMAHDASRNVMVLFGGARNSDDTPLGDTWELSASGWRRWPTETCTDPRPSARLSHGLTFVGNTNQVLLFGGANASGQRQLDTWLFNGSPCNGWSPQPNPPPPQSPYPTSDMAMAYDSARGEVVVFGGISDTLGIHNQTWTWVFTRSPSQWAQPPSNGTPPPARARGLMAYDGVRRKMVLFGGHNGTQILNDTWEWDGSTWTQRFPARQMPRLLWSHMAYDALTARCVLFGGMGLDGNNCPLTLDATYEWDGSDWILRNPVSRPSTRAGGQMAYDAQRETVVMFSGFQRAPCGPSYTGLQDMWEYNTPTRARYDLYGNGCLSSGGVPHLDAMPGQLPWIGGSFQMRVTNLPTAGATVILWLGFDRTTWLGIPLPFDLTGAGMPGCNLLTALDLVHSVGAAAGGTLILDASLVNDPALLGVAAFHQGLVLDGALNLSWTNGAALTFGLR